MAELTAGAAIGTAFNELWKVVVDQATPILRFKTQVNRLKKTLEIIHPALCRITEMGKELVRSVTETETFTHSLKNGRDLVLECSKIRFWNVCRKSVLAKKLIILDDEIVRYFRINAQVNIQSISMENLIEILVVKDRVDQVLAAVTGRTDGFSGWCRVPGLPAHIIGFDGHLAEVKRRMFKDETRVLVVSAPGGCGKTTLVKMLCHDDEIKGIYGKNILYVTVSKESSLTHIANKLFKHYGKNTCVFQTKEEAKNQIENLILQIGKGTDKMLLVLDDVWSGSESLVQDLKFQIPQYKILVTSRSVFRRFNSTYQLSLLNNEFAKTLLCYSAFPGDRNPVHVPDSLVNEMVTFCKGFPLALTVVGASLCGEDVLKWKSILNKQSQGKSILDIDSSMFVCLQTSIDALDKLPLVKECFFDLGSFPEDERIEISVLMDMWAELYKSKDNNMDASEYLLKLSLRNLVTLVQIRKYVGELDGYDNGYYITQHDLLRELAIHMSGQAPVKERNRLFIEINRNEFPTWWTQQTEQPFNARILSISTDEAFRSEWYDLNAPNVEVLILNIRSEIYALPKFIKKLSHLKVLIITGYGVYPTQLENLSFLGSVSNLKRIRFEHVSISRSIQIIFKLRNLKKIAFVTCKIGNALQNDGITDMLPNLTDLEIDGCYDLKELPAGLCSLLRLQRLTINNCHELDALPIDLGSLSNLQKLNLHGCTKLKKIPDTIGSMHNLSYLDISDCLHIDVLPEQIGELSGLTLLNMSGCGGIKELPESVKNLSSRLHVICDDEASHIWNFFGCNVKISVVEENRSEYFQIINR